MRGSLSPRRPAVKKARSSGSLRMVLCLALAKDREALLAFYDFPAEHWIHIRTTNPIESTFATVRLRTAKTRGCVSRGSILAMVFKLTKSAETMAQTERHRPSGPGGPRRALQRRTTRGGSENRRLTSSIHNICKKLVVRVGQL